MPGMGIHMVYACVQYPGIESLKGGGCGGPHIDLLHKKSIYLCS